MTVKSTCKVCGQQAPAEQFKLHYKYRSMVCPACYTGKTEQLRQNDKKKLQEQAREQKPAGWDAEDEYLERISRMRQAEVQAQFSRIPGTVELRCICAHCRYGFRYNPVKNLPRSCPYCNVEVPRLKSHYVL